MFLAKKRKYHIMLIICLVAAIISFGYVKAAYLTTNRDTKLPTDKVTYDITSFDEYELLYETDTIRYYYREDRDVLAIEDKRTGYTWKTGLDLAYNADIENALKEITDPAEKEKAALAQEVKMNATYIEMANSLVTVEYFDAESIKNVSSAAGKGVESSLVT
ncbi:MAG: ABC-type transport system, substrate-binding component, partial [Anaerocolumna sp.]|nr:ABC-type transport system, substrate-binding component [Anaerocolumna sp.]